MAAPPAGREACFHEHVFAQLRQTAQELLRQPEVRSLVLVVDWSEEYGVPYGMMLGRDEHGAPGPVRSPTPLIGCLNQTLKMVKHQVQLLEHQTRDLVELANALGKQLYPELHPDGTVPAPAR